MLSGLDQALSIVADGKNLKREIILLSDFRKQDWKDWDGTAVNAFKERLTSIPNSPELTFIDVGKESTKNLSVEKLVLSSQTIGIGHPVRIRATIQNYSLESFDGNLQVSLFADQNETAIDEAFISLGQMHRPKLHSLINLILRAQKLCIPK